MFFRLFKIRLGIVLASLLPLSAAAQDKIPTKSYGEGSPLIYEDAWNLWPYCYLNEHGEPEGYNVDLVKMLCKEMGIPCVIKLKSTREALSDLKAGRSDLMLGLDNRYERTDLRCSKSIVQLFTHSVVYPKGQKDYIHSTTDLGQQKVIVHKGSFCHHLMENRGWAANAIPMNDMKAAIKTLSSEGKGQIVWNTMSLKWLLRKFQMDNLEIASVDMPHGAYKFMSNDPALLARIDEAYKRLGAERSNFEELQNRWFYPEQVDSGIPSWVWYVAAVVTLIALILIYVNLNYRRLERKMQALNLRNTRQLAHILRISDMRLWTYDVATATFTSVNPQGVSDRKLPLQEIRRLLSADDFNQLEAAIRQVADGGQPQEPLIVRTAANDKTKGERLYNVVLSPLRQKDGKPTAILGTMNDITDEHRHKQEVNRLMTRYRSIFETAMVDMIFYDQDGNIANLNQRAMRTFSMDTKKARDLKINLRDIMQDRNLDMENFDYYYVTRSMKVYNQFMPDERPKASNIYYELQLVPVRDKDHCLIGAYGTGREVTEMVENWRQHRQKSLQLAKANREAGTYVKNIDYVLKVGGVRICNYSPQTHTLTVYSETDVVQHELTQSRCMTLVADSQKKQAMRLLGQMDNRTTKSIDFQLATILRPKGRQLMLHLSFIPVHDEKGGVSYYFGLCRDISDIKDTEQQLEKETVRAQEVEELKNSFLRNMSYEIRTPLNAVVGFAELFEMDHQQQDEEVFVSEIKDNASHLLHLVNDILFLSRLDAHMIELNPQPVDFAKTFESHCVTTWTGSERPGVHYVVQNQFDQLVVRIDDANVGLIINQVLNNAVQHTESGTVRARYDYFDGKLMIAIEDTGCGISEEKMAHIFDRFNNSGNNGTGLGLPISRELARQMGGHLDINSKPDNGTTVWIVIPCELIAMERRIEELTT